MLQKIDNNSVRGPYFTVTIPDIRTLVYSEGGKIAVIEIEGGGIDEPREVEWLVYAQTFRGWLPPHELVEISNEKRRQILENVSESLMTLGMAHKIVEQ